MASREIEIKHKDRINAILASRGLECIRSPPISLNDLADVVEEQALPEEEEEAVPEPSPPEELELEGWEEYFEEETEIFPGPSLRHLYPSNVRKIQDANRVHVLPDEFKTDIDPAAIPKIAVTPQRQYIDVIAELLGCKKYKSSLAEYWFLDTMANLLRRAQEDLLDRPTQAVLMVWFCEWMKEIQNFDAADRPRMMRRFKDNMLSAARFIAEEACLPLPEEAGVWYKALEPEPEDKSKSPIPTISEHKSKSPIATISQHKRSPHTLPSTNVVVTFETTPYQCAMGDLLKIMHYIFDLFSTDYQFNLVRSVFTYTPDYELIDAPYQIQTPKRIYVPLKAKPKKEKAKKDPKAAKGKKKEVDTAEYIALMELKAKEERDLDEQEEKDREDYNRRSHILPLNFAATDELFDRYWPPPPPEPPPPEPEPTTKKGKGKK